MTELLSNKVSTGELKARQRWPLLNIPLNGKDETIAKRLNVIFINLLREKLDDTKTSLPLKVLHSWVPFDERGYVNTTPASEFPTEEKWESLLYRTFGAQALFNKEYPPQARLTVTLDFEDKQQLKLFFFGVGAVKIGGVDEETKNLLFHVSSSTTKTYPGATPVDLYRAITASNLDPSKLETFSLEVTGVEPQGIPIQGEKALTVGFDENTEFILRDNQYWYRQTIRSDEGNSVAIYKASVTEDQATYLPGLQIKKPGKVDSKFMSDNNPSDVFLTERYGSLELSIEELFENTGIATPTVEAYRPARNNDISKDLLAKDTSVEGEEDETDDEEDKIDDDDEEGDETDDEEEGDETDDDEEDEPDQQQSPRGVASVNAAWSELDVSDIVNQRFRGLGLGYIHGLSPDVRDAFVEIARKSEESWKRIAEETIKKIDPGSYQGAQNVTTQEEARDFLKLIAENVANDILGGKMDEALEAARQKVEARQKERERGDAEAKEHREAEEKKNQFRERVEQAIVAYHNKSIGQLVDGEEKNIEEIGKTKEDVKKRFVIKTAQEYMDYTNLANDIVKKATDERMSKKEFELTTREEYPIDTKTTQMVMNYMAKKVKEFEERKRRLEKERKENEDRIAEFNRATVELGIDPDELYGAELIFDMKNTTRIPTLVFQDRESGRTTRVRFSEAYYQRDNRRWDIFKLNFRLAGPFPIVVSDQPEASRRGIYLAPVNHDVFVEISQKTYKLTENDKPFNPAENLENTALRTDDGRITVVIWVSPSVSTSASAVITHAVVVREQ